MKDDINYLISIICIIVAIVLIISGVIYRENNTEEKIYITAKEEFSALYKDVENEIPNENISMRKITETEKTVDKIVGHEEEKTEKKKALKNLKKYYELNQLINDIYVDGILDSKTTTKQIKTIKNMYNDLSLTYKEKLKSTITDIEKQKKSITNIEKQIESLFTDNKKQKVKETITREEVESIEKELNTLVQKDIIEKNTKYLNSAMKVVIKKEEEIKKAWVILDVPYISQNNNNVLNGCETASLLMALQYKGYLQNMTLQEYAENIPKSTDPNQGFTYDIFSIYPTNVPHWIAPSPLAEYGRVTSGNQNVIDITGYSVTQLDNEIIAGNPVVIYATSKFADPKEVIEGAPKNIHVLLLTGYNKITGEQLITDPWTHSDGRTTWTISKEKLETVYNAVGKKAVVIR